MLDQTQFDDIKNNDQLSKELLQQPILDTNELNTNIVFSDNEQQNKPASSLLTDQQTHKKKSYLSTELSNLASDSYELVAVGVKSVSFWNRFIIIRMSLLLLTILLILITTMYSYAQLNEMYLEDFICPQKSLQDIYQNSKFFDLTGGTTKGCWTSKGININNEILFSDSNQPYDSKYNYSTFNIIKSSVFAMFSVVLIIALIYFHIYSLINDIRLYYNGYFQQNNDVITNDTAEPANDHDGGSILKLCKTKCYLFKLFYRKTLGEDHCLYIMKLIFNEIIEVSLQTIICLKYNGIYITFDFSTFTIHINQDDISLAEKSELVFVFALIISMNCILTGFIWLLYTIKNRKYHGKAFRNLLVVVDSFFDFLYALYPIVIFLYNHNSLQAGVSSLNHGTWINFIGLVYPICTLSYRLCWGIKDVTKENYIYWREQYSNLDSDSDSDSDSEIIGDVSIDPYINDKCCCCMIFNGKKMLDETYDINLCDIKLCASDMISTHKRQQMVRRLVIMLFGMLCVLFGFAFVLLCIIHFYLYAPNVCNSPSNDILQNHLELTVWDSCGYKVYPFTLFKNDNLDIPCQCRVLNINLNENRYDDDIIDDILHSIFKNYYMLETVKISGSTTKDIQINFTSNPVDYSYSATKLRVFDLDNLRVNGLDDNISKWGENLEYFRLAYCSVSTIPTYDGMSSLTKLKYLSLEYSRLTNIDLDWLCTMKDLQYLVLNGNHFNTPFPSCIYNDLLSLTEIDISLNANSFNYKMLSLPNLHQFIAFGTDSLSLRSFPLNSSFDYNPTATYYLSGNTFCEQYNNDTNHPDLTIYMKSFFNETDSCTISCPGMKVISEYLICRPLQHRNGVCDPICNNHQCLFDGGDCNQLCDSECIESGTTVNNDECNEECNVQECNWDFTACIDDIDYNYTTCKSITNCELEWIGDNQCDNHCNVEICNFDISDCDDCDELNAPYCYSAWEYLLVFVGEDMLWSQSEICGSWQFLISLADNPMEGNCTQLMEYVDLDNSGYLNAHESLFAYVGFFQNLVGPKLFQINCSLCAPDIQTYYYPWNYSEIIYYTENGPDIAFQP